MCVCVCVCVCENKSSFPSHLFHNAGSRKGAIHDAHIRVIEQELFLVDGDDETLPQGHFNPFEGILRGVVGVFIFVTVHARPGLGDGEEGDEHGST